MQLKKNLMALVLFSIILCQWKGWKEVKLSKPHRSSIKHPWLEGENLKSVGGL